MKDIVKTIGLITLICFSFFYTEQVITVVSEQDPIMIKIKEEQDNYKVDVIEANIKSGTMHTANFTLNQKRLLICFNTNRSGNKFLLKNNNVMSINGKDDISRIKIQLDKVRESLENKK